VQSLAQYIQLLTRVYPLLHLGPNHKVMGIEPRVILLQCTSTYPAQYTDLHLRVLNTYEMEFPQVRAVLWIHMQRAYTTLITLT
jgi:hypothetical protein